MEVTVALETDTQSPLTKVRGRRITAITFIFAGGAISVVQQGQFQRS